MLFLNSLLDGWNDINWKLLQMGRRRSRRTERPALRYMKMRAWCSNSYHCDVMNGVHIAATDGGGALVVFIFIYANEEKRELNLKEEEKERKREREMFCIRKKWGRLPWREAQGGGVETWLLVSEEEEKWKKGVGGTTRHHF